MVAGSISARSWSFITASPMAICRALSWPDTCAPASTDFTASSVPTAVTAFSISPRVTGWVMIAVVVSAGA